VFQHLYLELCTLQFCSFTLQLFLNDMLLLIKKDIHTDISQTELCKRPRVTRYRLDELIQFPISVAPYISTPWHHEPSVQLVQITHSAGHKCECSYLSPCVRVSVRMHTHARVHMHAHTHTKRPPYTYTPTPVYRHPHNN
jgi:hypothetical protein